PTRALSRHSAGRVRSSSGGLAQRVECPPIFPNGLGMPFYALGLLPQLARALAERGYTEPTPIQRRVIPEILAGRDILAGAQTGTGKTAGFTLPILQHLDAGPTHNDPHALILLPTREPP